MRAFLVQYDEFVSAGHGFALRSDPRLASQSAPAGAFLARMAVVRAFMAPMVDNPRRATEFTLTIGEGDLQRVERWIYGQPVIVSGTTEDSLGMVEERTVTGGWSAIRAARLGGGFERVRVFHPDTKRELVAPEFPTAAPEIPGYSVQTQRPAPAPRRAAPPTRRPTARCP